MWALQKAKNLMASIAASFKSSLNLIFTLFYCYKKSKGQHDIGITVQNMDFATFAQDRTMEGQADSIRFFFKISSSLS